MDSADEFEKVVQAELNPGGSSSFKTPINKPSSSTSAGHKTVSAEVGRVQDMDQDKQLIQLMGGSHPVLLTAMDNLGDSSQEHIDVVSGVHIGCEGRSSCMPKHGSDDSAARLGSASYETIVTEAIDEDVTIIGELNSPSLECGKKHGLHAK